MNSSVKKRQNYIEWNDYFMFLACLSSMRSKDPNTQVGACIVNDQNKIVGLGYNGMPIGCSDDVLPWASEDKDFLKVKNSYVCCAELNAVMNKNCPDVRGCRLYVTLYPCNECAKVLIQAGIKEVIYMSDKNHSKEYAQASRKLLELAGIKTTKFVPKKKKVLLDMHIYD